MKAACFLQLSAFFLMLAGGQSLAFTYADSAVDERPDGTHPDFEEEASSWFEEETSGWYRESGSDTHLMLGKETGITFEDHRMSTHLTLVSLFAAGAALAGRLPALWGYGSSTFMERITTSLPSLVLPGIVAWRSLKQWREKDSRKRRYFIHVADNVSLERRLSLQFKQSISSQSLSLRIAPFSLTGPLARLPINEAGTTPPLARLAENIINLEGDRLEIVWPDKSSPLEIKIWQSGSRQTSLEIREWGKTLNKRVRTQKIPALLSFLQPEGLTQINNLLECLAEHQIGPNACPGGDLIQDIESDYRRQFHFKPRLPHNLPLLKGQVLGHNYLLPLPPCSSESQCAMAMVWPVEEGKSYPSTLPGTNSKLYIYSRPTDLTQLPQELPNLPGPIMKRVAPWLIDIMTLVPYAALNLGVDQLAAKGLSWYGIDIAAAGSSAGLFGTGWFSGKDTGYGTHHTPSIDSSDKGELDSTVWMPRDNLSRVDRDIVKAIDADIPREILFNLVDTKSHVLANAGNSCFLDASVTYLAQTLTNEELSAIESNKYNHRHYRKNDDDRLYARSFSKNKKNAAKLTRTKFVELARALRKHSSERTLTRLRDDFFHAIRSYIKNAPNSGVSKSFLGGDSNIENLDQRDASEFMQQLHDVLGIRVNPSSYLGYQHLIQYQVGKDTYPYTNHNDSDRFDIVTIGIPVHPDAYTEHGIHDMSSLIDSLQTPQQHNDLNLSAEVALQIGVKDPTVRKKGKKAVKGTRAMELIHPDPDQLQHLTLHTNIYRHHHGRAQKIRKVTRSLLAQSGDNIEIPLRHGDETIRIGMKVDGIIMHRGDDANSGHYVTATRKGEQWYIHDDLRSKVMRLEPNGNISPFDTLINYMERQNLDPYLMHYRRQ